MLMNGVNKLISDNTILSEVENGKISLPARWQFGTFGVPRKNDCEICEALKGRATFATEKPSPFCGCVLFCAGPSFGVFGVPKKNHCKICNALKRRTQIFHTDVEKNNNLSILSALKSRFPPSRLGGKRESRNFRKH